MFDMDENTAVITTRDIMNKKKRVVLVFHDTDEIWQFLDGEEVSNENAAVVSISEMEQIEPSICELCELPSGWGAFREDESKPWEWFETEATDSGEPV